MSELSLLESPVLKTRRLTLRRPGQGDAIGIAQNLADPAIRRMMGVLPWPYQRAHAEAFIARVRALPLEGRECVLGLVIDDQLIGIIRIGPRDNRLFLSYWLAQSHWQRGFMSEAVPAMISHYFMSRNPDEIYADYYADNCVSAHILQNFGFEFVGESLVRCEFRGGDAVEICTRLRRAHFEELMA